jgi:hypothetical protein
VQCGVDSVAVFTRCSILPGVYNGCLLKSLVAARA